MSNKEIYLRTTSKEEAETAVAAGLWGVQNHAGLSRSLCFAVRWTGTNQEGHRPSCLLVVKTQPGEVKPTGELLAKIMEAMYPGWVPPLFEIASRPPKEEKPPGKFLTKWGNSLSPDSLRRLPGERVTAVVPLTDTFCRRVKSWGRIPFLELVKKTALGSGLLEREIGASLRKIDGIQLYGNTSLQNLAANLVSLLSQR